MDDQVTALLRRAADAGGEFVPPDIAALAARGRRRTMTHTTRAVAAGVVLIVGLAIGLHFAGSGSRRPVAQTSSTAAGPSLSALEHGRWSSLPRAPIAPRDPAIMAWTGSQLIIWGGANYDARRARVYTDGATYTPATRSWQMLPKAPLSPRGAATRFAWTGSVLFVWDTDSASDRRAVGETYDPRSRQWRLLPAAPIPEFEDAEPVAIDGKVVLITDRRGDTATIYADEYDPASSRWTALPDLTLPSGHPLNYFAALGADDRIFVWSMWVSPGTTGPTGDDGFALDPGTRTWRSVPIDADAGFNPGRPLWIGSQVLLLDPQPWCGTMCTPGPNYQDSSLAIDPVTGTRTRLAPFNVDVDNVVWTGSFVIAFSDRYPNRSQFPGITAAWDPQRNRWADIPSPAHGFAFVEAAWTGRTALVWTENGRLLDFAAR